MAEERLVPFEGDELVRHESVRVGVESLPVEVAGLRATAEVGAHLRHLRFTRRVQAIEQSLHTRSERRSSHARCLPDRRTAFHCPLWSNDRPLLPLESPPPPGSR